jgi:ATP-dependent DNA helicase RecQ
MPPIPAPPSTSSADDLSSALPRFQHTHFLAGQREAIETLLSRGRLLLVAPTGGGKSLTYQLPASLLPGTTLVVSPLIALMHDQVGALEAVGVPATYIASTLEPGEIERRLGAAARGEFSLLYVAPERLALPGFRRLLADLSCPLLAIDEAHCISEWGHDFRPDYLQLGGLLETLPDARVLACTATATPIVRDEIVARLGLPADTPQLVTGFARPNLSLRAAEVASRKERNTRLEAALGEALGGPGARGPGGGKAIVYSPTRRGAEDEASRLAAKGWLTDVYHAGLPAREREEAQRRFTCDELDVVVATNAFGMGIDEPNVRAVVHLGPPGSLEAYYQEVGRAGRDGEPALGLLLHSGQDLPLRRRLLELPSDDQPPAPEVVEHKWSLFLELLRWAEGGTCRHDAILRYFGDEAETLSGCGVCDECHRLAGLEDDGQEPEFSAEETTEIARKALSAVARIHGRLGLGAAVKLLRGEEDDRLQRYGLDRVATFGTLRERSAEWLTRLVRRCVTAGWVGFTGEDRPVALLTEVGARVMRAEVPARIVLPPLSRPVRAADSPARRARGGATRAPGAMSADEQSLFEALRAHRLEVSKAQGVPPYVVAHDRTLHDLVHQRPRAYEDLLAVDGIGPKKAERYGEGFLQVIRSARQADRPGTAL